MIGSDHMQSISAANGQEVVRKKENGVDHFVRSQAAGGAQDDENVSSQRIFSADTLMWSDHDTIRPHAKYQRRKWPGSRSEKKNDV
jgi:hypothetical protein